MRPWIEKYIVAVIATGITRLGDVEHAYGPETLQIMVVRVLKRLLGSH